MKYLLPNLRYFKSVKTVDCVQIIIIITTAGRVRDGNTQRYGCSRNTRLGLDDATNWISVASSSRIIEDEATPSFSNTFTYKCRSPTFFFPNVFAVQKINSELLAKPKNPTLFQLLGSPKINNATCTVLKIIKDIINFKKKSSYSPEQKKNKKKADNFYIRIKLSDIYNNFLN